MSDIEPIQFYATVPDIASAIKVHGAEGFRLQLDIPECDLVAVAQLIAVRRERAFRVTFEAMPEGWWPEREENDG